MTEKPREGVELLEELREAIRQGETERARELVEADRSLARGTSPEGPPLTLWAVYHGHPEIADLLLRHGAEVDAFTAAALGRTDQLRVLLDRGEATVSDRSADGWTPLHLAAFFGHRDTAEILIERGAELGAVSENAMRNTPLHAAAAAGRLAVAELLVERGADPSAPAAEGLTPLDIAIGDGHDEVARLLEGRGARRGREEGGDA